MFFSMQVFSTKERMYKLYAVCTAVCALVGAVLAVGPTSPDNRGDCL